MRKEVKVFISPWLVLAKSDFFLFLPSCSNSKVMQAMKLSVQ